MLAAQAGLEEAGEDLLKTLCLQDQYGRPRHVNSVLADIRHKLAEARDTVIPLGMGYKLDPRRRMFWLPKQKEGVSLTEKETQLLKYLREISPQYASAERLLINVWNYVPEMDTHTVQTHIYRLRQKIEPDPDSPQILVTDMDGAYGLAIASDSR